MIPYLRFLALSAAVLAFSHCRQAESTTAVPGDVESTDVESADPEASVPRSALPEEVSFNEHIQPILSEYCYHCHGPDEGTRYPEDAPLRLDLVEEAFKPRDNGEPVIIKGDPAASMLVARIHSQDENVVMPPPESHKELSAHQISLLEKWIEQGAEYQDHWAFLPVEKPELPAAGSDWAANPIDRFIAERLEINGLAPNPQEDPDRFYRRLHLDLTGLPPAPEAADAFTWDKLESEIDRLLATPASAEHLARHWLDAARYADTHGIHIDNRRSIYPYRDWVIEAFRQNIPFDQFTIEQIAGDLLPDRTLDQLVATGFNRCLPTTGEGGAIAEEYEAIYAQDQTDTTSAVWLGLTMGCAACHDHKFDPIPAEDVYSFNAFFRNTTMKAMDGNNANHPPNVFVPHRDDRDEYPALVSDLESTQQALARRKDEARPDFENWLPTASIEAIRDIDSSLALHLPLNGFNGKITGLVDGQPREWETTLPAIEAPFGDAPVISAEPVTLGDIGSFGRHDQVTYGGFVRIEGTPTGAIVARMDPADGHRGWDLYLQEGKPAAHIIESWDKSATKVVGPDVLTPGTWHHVMVTFDGTLAGHQTTRLFVDGKRVNAGPDPNTVGEPIETKVPLRLGARDQDDSKLSGGSVALQDFRLYRRLLRPEEIDDLASNSLLRQTLATPDADRTDQQTEALYSYFISNVDRPTLEYRTRIDELEVRKKALDDRGSISLVMEERADSEPHAHVLIRGVYSDKGEQVAANTPSALPPMPDDAPRNRLGLARWLVDPANPLTPRVTMNRTWYYFFGTGIVETTADFGIMGARPSHPKLLDWLAAEFVDSGWDYRHMLKLIVSSAAYRQSGNVTPQKLEADPDNRLISRGPRYRLDAEQIRDLALAASGLLSEKVGGPSVRPYQPVGIWEAVAMPQSNTKQYQQDSGESLYRRSLYTFWKRTAPHPAMEIFNAPTREVFCVRRDRTNTPLQTLVTLNDPQFVEASRNLAQQALQGSEDSEVSTAALDHITLRLISRTLTDEERPHVLETLEAALNHFNNDPEAAKSLITEGETEPDPSLDPAELAAWTLVASQILNLDEALTK